MRPARISHKASVTAAEKPMTTASRLKKVLNAATAAPPRFFLRAPCIHGLLRRLTTIPCEKCGLRFFFHRDSKFVRTLEALGALLFIPMAVKEHASPVFWIYFLEYLMVRFCHNFNWYPFPSPLRGGGRGEGRHPDELGIRLHFKKALVAASYIIFIANAAFLLTGRCAFIYIGLALLAAVLYLHAVLLYLHFRDRDERGQY